MNPFDNIDPLQDRVSVNIPGERTFRRPVRIVRRTPRPAAPAPNEPPVIRDQDDIILAMAANISRRRELEGSTRRQDERERSRLEYQQVRDRRELRIAVTGLPPVQVNQNWFPQHVYDQTLYFDENLTNMDPMSVMTVSEEETELSTREMLASLLRYVDRNPNTVFGVGAGPIRRYVILNSESIAQQSEILETIMEDPAQTYDPDNYGYYNMQRFLQDGVLRVARFTDRGTNGRNETETGFMPYYNDSPDHDLSRQGIFTEDQIEEYARTEKGPASEVAYPCVLVALERAGLDKALIEELSIGMRHRRDINVKPVSAFLRSKGVAFNHAIVRPGRNEITANKLGCRAAEPEFRIASFLGHTFVDDYTCDASGNTLVRGGLGPNSNQPERPFAVIRDLYKRGLLRRMSPEHTLACSRSYRDFLSSNYDITVKPGENTETLKSPHEQYLSRLYWGQKHPSTDTEDEAKERGKRAYIAKVVAFDIESYTNQSNRKFGRSFHPSLIRARVVGTNEEYEQRVPANTKKFFDWLTRGVGKKEKVVAYAHYATFDIAQLLDICDESVKFGRHAIYDGKHMYSLTISHYGKEIEFRDFYMITQAKLEVCASIFLGKNQGKEIYPHSIRTAKNTRLGYVTVDELRNAPEFNEGGDLYRRWNQFINKGAKEYIKDGKFLLNDYDSFYCKKDVDILEACIRENRERSIKALNIDPLFVLTTASMATIYYDMRGCMEGVVSLSAGPQAFVSRAIRGGRVTTAENKVRILKGEIVDSDVNSLYPTAYTMMGIPTGEPYEFSKEGPSPKSKFYVAEIRVNDIRKRRKIPCISRIKPGGGVEWSNEIRGVLVLDQHTIEDAVKYHEMDFEYIRGYEWRSTNDKCIEVTREMYRRRAEMKKLEKKGEKTAQQHLKLILNSFYGKQAENPHEYEHAILSLKDAVKYLSGHKSNVEEVTFIGVGNNVIVKKRGRTLGHYNNAHVAASILGLSKRWVNRVLYDIEDNGGTVAYSDTDSMHMFVDDWKACVKRHKARGIELEGKGLGQFESDFVKEGVGTFAIYGSPKAYTVAMSGVERHEEDGEDDVFGQFRAGDPVLDEEGNTIPATTNKFKGIPGSLLQHNHYKYLAMGESLKYDLLTGKSGMRITGLEAGIPEGEHRTADFGDREVIVNTRH